MRASIILVLSLLSYMVGYNSGSNAGYANGKCESERFGEYEKCKEKNK